jgi:hypothetical protein
VFWHWPAAHVEHRVYEDELRAFQRSLARHGPPGFRGASVFRHGPAPWLAHYGSGYADWYLTDGSAVLDPLNDAAVSAACSGHHDRVAEHAAGGIAGLYRLALGVPCWSEVRQATWFAKPQGMGYEALYDMVGAAMDGRQCSLWSRQMTLGPTLELCVLGPDVLALPGEFEAMDIAMEPIISHE